MAFDEHALEKIRRELDGPDPLDEVGNAISACGSWAQWSLDRQIWYLRAVSGLTQTELSRRSGISLARISRLEAGADMKLSTLKSLWAALGFQPLILPEPVGRPKEGRPGRKR